MIIISPYSAKLFDGKENPKNYPYWRELLKLIGNGEHIIQVGVDGENQLVDDFRKDLSVADLNKLIDECRIWVSCDSFFQHLAWKQKKRGIVLWSVSDPNIYGHSENINLLKSREYLAANQFLWWQYVPHNPEAFVAPTEIIKHLDWKWHE